MAKNKKGGKPQAVQRELLGKSVAVIGFGIALYFASFFIGGSPALAPVAKALRSVAPWAIAVGGLLLLLRFALERASRPEKPKPTPSTDFDAFNDPPAPAHHLPAQRSPATQSPARVRADSWCDKVFEDIEWRRFEALCEALFGQAGFETKSQSHGADGGIDIWLYSRHATGPAAIVQCKHWRKPVGVKELREFFGVMTSHGLQRGTFATSSTFTPDAAEFAKKNRISALDRAALLRLICTRDTDQQRRLLAVAYDGEYWRPTCASCGTKMVERSSRTNQGKFWGCANYPRCRSKLHMG